MNNGWTGFVIFLLADPHLLEGGQRSQDGATDPDGVFTLRGSDDLDLHGAGGQGCDFLLHPVSNTREHGGTSGQHSVSIQIFPDVDIAFHDGVVGGLMDTSRFHTQEGRLEQRFWAPEPLITNGDYLTIRQLVALLKGGRRSGGGHLLFEVKSNIAQFLLDVTNNFSLGGGCE